MKNRTRVSVGLEAQYCDEGCRRASAFPADLDRISRHMLAAATSARERLAARRKRSRDLVDQLLGGDHVARWVWLGSTTALADSETLAELLRRSGDRSLRAADRDYLLSCLLPASLQHSRVQRSPRLPRNPLLPTFLGLAEIALEAGDFSRAESMLETARSTASVASGDPRLLARSTLLRALIHWNRREFRSALDLLERVGELGRELADLDLEAQALLLSVRIQRTLGNFEAVRVAEAHLRRRIPRPVMARVTQRIEQVLSPSARAALFPRQEPKTSLG